MITITSTRFQIEGFDYLLQEKTVRLFGWVICRWQERYAPQPAK